MKTIQLMRKFMEEKKNKIMLLLILIAMASFTFVSQTITSAQEGIIPMNQYNNQISSKEILSQIDNGENVYYEDVTITGDLDFSQSLNTAKIEENTYAVDINSVIVFRNCEFTGNILGVHTDASDSRYYVRFNRPVSFSNSEIKGEVNFFRTVFNGKVDFSNSRFNQKILLKDTLFKEQASFKSVVFESETDFRTIEFYSRAIFSNSIFKNNTIFLASKFHHTAEFDSSQFHKGIDFYRSVFGEAYFGYAKINGLLNASEASFSFVADFGGASITSADFTMADFRGKVSFEIVKILQCDFGDSQFNTSRLNMEDADWGKYSFKNTTRFGLDYSPVVSKN
jgi:uncharacterized protein YjbI with pentapeptide repeats